MRVQGWDDSFWTPVAERFTRRSFPRQRPCSWWRYLAYLQGGDTLQHFQLCFEELREARVKSAERVGWWRQRPREVCSSLLLRDARTVRCGSHRFSRVDTGVRRQGVRETVRHSGQEFGALALVYTHKRSRLTGKKKKSHQQNKAHSDVQQPATPRWGCAAHSPVTPFINQTERKGVPERRGSKGEINKGWEVRGDAAKQQRENGVF